MGRILLKSPARFADLNIVWNFRKMWERKRQQETCHLDAAQYIWAAEVSGVPGLKVRQTVQEWLYERPLPYLAGCRYEGVRELFALPRVKGIAIGIFSDYPAEAKLGALGLVSDVVVTATQKEVSRLKPHPQGLLVAAAKLNIPKEACLFIGDEDNKDGECARRAGMPYLFLAPGKRAQQFLRLQEWVKKCPG